MSYEEACKPDSDGSEPEIPQAAIEVASDNVTKTDMIDLSAVMIRLIQEKDNALEKVLREINEQHKAELVRRDKSMRILFITCIVLCAISAAFCVELLLDLFFLHDYGRFRW